MAVEIDQTGRELTLEIDGALSKDFVPTAFSGREAVSTLPHYTVDVISDKLTLDPTTVLGHPASIIITPAAGITRRFSGIVTAVSPGDLLGWSYRSYRFEVRPKLWLATLNARCRSFLSQSANDIVTAVLSGHGINPAFRGAGDTTRPQRDYCLQYCESDYDFMSRLLEDEGFYFYFPLDHKDNSLTIVDGINGSFAAADTLDIGPHEAITSWARTIRTVPQQVTFSGYDFTQASIQTASSPASNTLSYASSATIEAYTSVITDKPRSPFFAQMSMQRLEAEYETFQGASAHPNLSPGGRFQVGTGEHMGEVAGKSFVIIEAQHHASCPTHFAGQGGGAWEFGNSFTCIPLDTHYRPPRRAPRPIIHGVQTAKVSSDPDKYGRVKVKFHWGNELESWWLRVAMPWAHNQMGFQFFPRTGSEVVVQFLEGDPERPIIIGAVFNGVNNPIYTVPDNKTQSGIRGTDPSKTGSAQNFNEFKFEDKPGDELVFLFAQKDMNRIVVNNDTLEVKQGNRSVTIDQGNLTTTLSQGNETHELKMGNLTTTLDQGNETRELKMGNLTTKVDLGAASTEAMQSIELKVGGNSIKIDQTGVTITGIMIKLQGNAQVQVQAPMVQVQGQGMLQLQGGITMIG